LVTREAPTLRGPSACTVGTLFRMGRHSARSDISRSAQVVRPLQDRGRCCVVAGTFITSSCSR